MAPSSSVIISIEVAKWIIFLLSQNVLQIEVISNQSSATYGPASPIPPIIQQVSNRMRIDRVHEKCLIVLVFQEAGESFVFLIANLLKFVAVFNKRLFLL